MHMTELQRVVLETTATRDRAEALLEGLLRAKGETERERTRLNRVDLMEQVRGESAIDQAISSTRRMIETLNRTLRQARQDLIEEQDAALDLTPRVGNAGGRDTFDTSRITDAPSAKA